MLWVCLVFLFGGGWKSLYGQISTYCYVGTSFHLLFLKSFVLVREKFNLKILSMQFPFSAYHF